MKIRRINYLMIAITSVIFLFSCNNNSTGEEKTAVTRHEELNTSANTSKETTITEPATCYALDNGKDKVVMQIAIANNAVTGDLMYNYFEKDKNSGTIKGQMKGDTLFGTYTFMSEGKQSQREVAFLKKGDELVEGYGNVNPSTGKPDLSDRSSIKFENNLILKKTDCKTDEHGCMVLMGKRWSAIKNDCIDPSKTAIRLNPVEMKDEGKSAAYLIFSEDRSKGELYLPQRDSAVIMERKGKEGNWTWQYEDLKLIPWKGYVLQKKGVAMYAGDEGM